VHLIWLVDLDRKVVLGDGAERAPRALSGDDVLDGEDVVPGLRLPERQVFD
jgi:hypothetical protein